MDEEELMRHVGSYLSDIGSCWRCILIFLGESNVNLFSKCNEELVDDVPHKELQEATISVDNGKVESAEASNPKRLRMCVCVSCLGLLQNCTSADTISQLSSVINESDFDADEFSLALSLPVSVIIRIHAVWAHLLRKFPTIFPTMEEKPPRVTHVGVLKNIWRSLTGAEIASTVDKKVVSGQSTFLSLEVQASYEGNEVECVQLEKLDERKFWTRRKQHRKFAEGVFTKQVIDDTLQATTDERFLTLYPELPTSPANGVVYSDVKCSHTSIYLAGRYNKYSRELSQTPWFVDGERKMESSVQELICTPLNRRVKADGMKFSASGREDVDVRCLGKGRPFVIEFQNPRRTKVTQSELYAFQEEVNSSTELVSIRDLQLITKKDTSNLKEGEEEKTKSYCALCLCKDGVTDEMLDKVNGISELTLTQTTPIRVLHRRNLSDRERNIHTCRAERVDEYFFKVYLNTQAGTYIKEFVHGDFGRTTPSLGSIVGSPCDIIALDVEDIHLAWPPYLD